MPSLKADDLRANEYSSGAGTVDKNDGHHNRRNHDEEQYRNPERRR